jgi:hypothetical protein
MTKRKTKIIRDNKRRGEWAESVFMARAAENGLPVSKPLGESSSFDCVVGRPGKFVAVQVKCTMAKITTGKGYVCAIKHNNQAYRVGSFDFVAAYVIPEDAWYIVPAKLIRKQATICLCSPAGRFEQYREAWHLLREATACEEAEQEPEPQRSGESPFMARMRASVGFMHSHLAKSGEE